MESTNPLPVDGGIGRRRLPDGRDAEAAPDLVNQAFWWGEVTDVRLHYAQARNRTDRAAQVSSEVLLWGCEAGAGCYGGGCRAGGLVVVIVVVLLVERGLPGACRCSGTDRGAATAALLEAQGSAVDNTDVVVVNGDLQVLQRPPQ
ncbi:hypothetical protein ACKVWC_007346 [Pyricularia oryzae]